MNKNNWKQTSRNFGLNTSIRGNNKKKFRHSAEIQLSVIDQNRLKGFQVNELKYFNSLVEILQNRARVFPQTLIDLSPEQQKLLGLFANLGVTVKQLKSSEEIPSKLEPFREFWTNPGKKGYINPSLEILYNIAGNNILLDPNIKENMALELLGFFIEQAEAFSNTVNSSKLDLSYKIAPQVINTVEITQKRHIQLPRKSTKTIWSTKDDCSYISTPYTTQPIKLENINLNEDLEWDLLMIHQTPGGFVSWNTPWLIELQKTNSKYLIKYLDMANPRAGSAFSAAARGR